jgi:hypothetical protein
MTTATPIAARPDTSGHDLDCSAIRLLDELAARLDAAGRLARPDRVRVGNVVHALLGRMPAGMRREALGD